MPLMAGNNECGIRIRFRVRYRDRVPNPYPLLTRELIRWCEIFDREGLTPVEGGASAGNLSFRTPPGFVITPTRSRLKSDIDWRSLVEVVRADWGRYELHVLGPQAPSSDSFLHERIYALRPDVNAVFHGHDELVLDRADALARELPVTLTGEARLFGTPGDARSTAEDLGSRSYIIRRGHGFVSVGRTLAHAGELALRMHRRAAAL